MSQKSGRNVPDIRFPGFEGKWEFSHAGSLFKNRVSKGSKELPIFSVTQANGMVERSSLDREFDNISNPEGNRFVKKDDIAYNMMRMWQGAVGVAPVDCMISPAYVVLAPNSDVFSQFYYKMFKSKKYLYLLTSYSQGLTSDRLRLYYKEFAQINLPHPVMEEQQKIASFLSDIDTKIEKLSLKKELLKQYKKGIMQKLFSREIRFKPALSEAEGDKNGEEFPEWKEKKLGEIGTTYSGLTNKTATDFGSGSPFITYKMIYDNSLINLEQCESVNINEGERQSEVNQGDIFFTTSSETPKEVAMISVLLHKPLTSCYLNSFCFGYRLHSVDEYHPGFFRFYFRSTIIRKVLLPLAQGSTRFNISKYELMKQLIAFPDIQEQKKIAVFLSDFDSKINQMDKEISSITEFKKGLLQRMFVC